MLRYAAFITLPYATMPRRLPPLPDERLFSRAPACHDCRHFSSMPAHIYAISPSAPALMLPRAGVSALLRLRCCFRLRALCRRYAV